jgi:hypothetical protein
MEPKVSLPHSQAPVTFPILGQINPVQASQTHVLNIHLILSSHIFRGLPNGLFSLDHPTKILSAHLLPPPHTHNFSWFDHPNNQKDQQINKV